MNHLAHFLLSEQAPALLVGGLLGDYVKGRLKGQYGPEVEAGIKLHRAIDAFTDKHPMVRTSCRRPDTEFRRVAPIMTDIFYDYFLARHWSKFHAISLRQFSERVTRTILNYEIELPSDAHKFISYMAHNRSLENYGDPAFIQRSFVHLNNRLKRDNPLDIAFSQFEKCESGLEEDFLSFFPELVQFTQSWITENDCRE